MRDDERDGAAVSSPCLDADERTGERLQLYARERGPIRDQPHVREHPDQHGPRNRNHDDSKAEPTRKAQRPPMRPHFSPHSRWHQLGHKQLEAFRTLLTL